MRSFGVRVIAGQQFDGTEGADVPGIYSALRLRARRWIIDVSLPVVQHCHQQSELDNSRNDGGELVVVEQQQVHDGEVNEQGEVAEADALPFPVGEQINRADDQHHANQTLQHLELEEPVGDGLTYVPGGDSGRSPQDIVDE